MYVPLCNLHYHSIITGQKYLDVELEYELLTKTNKQITGISHYSQ